MDCEIAPGFSERGVRGFLLYKQLAPNEQEKPGLMIARNPPL